MSDTFWAIRQREIANRAAAAGAAKAPKKTTTKTKAKAKAKAKPAAKIPVYVEEPVIEEDEG